MNQETKSYIKNGIIAMSASIAAGIGFSELSDLVSDNGKFIGAASTIAEYVASWAVFLPLQARDLKKRYSSNGNFNKKQFALDNTKLGLAFLALDAAYLLGRPFMQNYFIENNFSASGSSLASDGVFMTAYFALSVPLAYFSGVIKKEKKPEEIK